MKHTQLLDALRNIKKQWVSFLSIVLIVMLGVMVYLGINFAANSMKQGGDKYYEKTKMWRSMPLFLCPISILRR